MTCAQIGWPGLLLAQYNITMSLHLRDEEELFEQTDEFNLAQFLESIYIAGRKNTAQKPREAEL